MAAPELFLLTPLREGRHKTWFARSFSGTYFYSRPCGRGDRSGIPGPQVHSHFYSRPCGRGDDHEPAPHNAPAYFYSRPCGRGDFLRLPTRLLCMRISTHAPAGGATWIIIMPVGVISISTHAPAGGATSPRTSKNSTAMYFYSRPCGRGDRRGRRRIPAPAKISTHAPAGGATVCETGSAAALHSISTHAPAGGATRDLLGLLLLLLYFYSRPCGRGDYGEADKRTMQWHFYSRPCGRGDVQIDRVYEQIYISTHAPAGGATGRERVPCRAVGDFYSRPCGRGDAYRSSFCMSSSKFLLTPLREGRPVSLS